MRSVPRTIAVFPIGHCDHTVRTVRGAVDDHATVAYASTSKSTGKVGSATRTTAVLRIAMMSPTTMTAAIFITGVPAAAMGTPVRMGGTMEAEMPIVTVTHPMRDNCPGRDRPRCTDGGGGSTNRAPNE